jgi:hypothetical protein
MRQRQGFTLCSNDDAAAWLAAPAYSPDSEKPACASLARVAAVPEPVRPGERALPDVGDVPPRPPHEDANGGRETPIVRHPPVGLGSRAIITALSAAETTPALIAEAISAAMTLNALSEEPRGCEDARYQVRQK